MSRKTLLFIIIIAVVASIAIGIVAALDNPEYYREKIQPPLKQRPVLILKSMVN